MGAPSSFFSRQGAAPILPPRAPESFPPYVVYVSNERSNDVTVIDGEKNAVIAGFAVGKRPARNSLFPRRQAGVCRARGRPGWAPGSIASRAVADKEADGLGVIDPSTRNDDREDSGRIGSRKSSRSRKTEPAPSSPTKISAPFRLSISRSGKLAGEVRVSDEPEGVAVNPANGQVYVTCEEKGEVYVIDAEHAISPAHFTVGARPRSVAFLPDGSRALSPPKRRLPSPLSTPRRIR